MAGINEDGDTSAKLAEARQSIQELTRQQEASEQEFKRREQEYQRREQEYQRREQESQRREQELVRENTDSTLTEALEYYHEYSKKMQVETDRKNTTQGGTTNPKGRPCPTILKEWTSFPAERDAKMKRVLEVMQQGNEEIRCFDPKLVIERLIDQETKEKVGSEMDLRIQLHLFLETPTAKISSRLAQKWNLGGRVIFRNHDNFEKEMLDADDHHHAAADPDYVESKKKSVPVDQVCLLQIDSGRMRPLFVVEHKPPHKMARDTMFSGLDREINLPNEIINVPTIPNDAHEKSVYNSKRMVCAAITQAYEYMLSSPTTHACVVTGETIVFLRIDESDTTILHYYLTEPLEQVEAAIRESFPFPYRYTALAQLVAFTVLAFDAPTRSKNWQTKAESIAAKWEVDPDVLLSQIYEEQTKETPPASIARIRIRKLEERRTPVKTRSTTRNLTQTSFDVPSELTRRRTPPDSDNDESDIPDTPTKRGQVAKRGRPSDQGNKTHRSNQQRQEPQKRQYCTHACLLGLSHGLPLDTQCPNTDAHRRPDSSSYHVLTQLQLVEAIREQLGHDLETGVEELNLKGRRGSLFRLELLSHGYVVVAKACISAFADESRKEGQVYRRLESLQGDMIPVYLGNFDMINPWIEMYYRFTHMLLMSHAGGDIQRGEGIDIDQYAGPYVARCAELGVFNNDLHSGNVLWNEERKSVMFIDLGEVTLFEPRAKGAEAVEEAATLPTRRILQELEVNKHRVPDLSSETRGQKRKWVYTEEMREESLAENRKKWGQKWARPTHKAVQRLRTH